MPTYLYLCENNPDPQHPENNGTEFEEFSQTTKALESCPVCLEKGMPPHTPKRLICGNVRGRVELTGQDANQKFNQDVSKLKKQLHTNENFRSNFEGESNFHKRVK